MLYLAILGVVVNGAAVFKLRKGKSLNEKVVSLHLLEDVLGWVAVLIGSIVMIYFDLPFVDPLLSILISIFVLYNVYRNLKKSMRVILQGTPKEVSLINIEKKVKEISVISEVHDCHIWSLDGSYNILTMHIRLEKDLRLSKIVEIKKKIHSVLNNDPIQHITIEFEGIDENYHTNEI